MAIEPSCPHAIPQAASQLHGICIFCYRDRLAAVRAENAALRERVALLERVREAAQGVLTAAWTGDPIPRLRATLAAAKEGQ